MLENIANTITHLAMDQLGRKLAGRIPSRFRHVRHNAVAMATAVALQWRTGLSVVMGVWRPNAWTNFGEFGIQQQIRTTMKVAWSNIKIFQIQNGGLSSLENIRNAITRLPMDRLGRTWVVASHHVPNIGNAITLTMGPIGTTLGWPRPSNTSAAKPFPWYWSLLLTAQWTF